MSFDTLFSLALFAGALFLIMRFGCGAHMGHAHNHRGSSSDRTGGADTASSSSAHSASPGSVSSGNASPEKSNASFVNNAGDASPGNEKAHRRGCC